MFASPIGSICTSAIGNSASHRNNSGNGPACSHSNSRPRVCRRLTFAGGVSEATSSPSRARTRRTSRSFARHLPVDEPASLAESPRGRKTCSAPPAATCEENNTAWPRISSPRRVWPSSYSRIARIERVGRLVKNKQRRLRQQHFTHQRRSCVSMPDDICDNGRAISMSNCLRQYDKPGVRSVHGGRRAERKSMSWMMVTSIYIVAVSPGDQPRHGRRALTLSGPAIRHASAIAARPAVGLREAEQHADGRRFAGAVRAEDADDFAGAGARGQRARSRARNWPYFSSGCSGCTAAW